MYSYCYLRHFSGGQKYYTFRRSLLLRANLVKVTKDNDVIVPSQTQQTQKRKRINRKSVSEISESGELINSFAVSLRAVRGDGIELVMNFKGMTRRRARERARRASKYLLDRSDMEKEIHLRETYYISSLPVLYIVLGMLLCIGRLIAGDLRSNFGGYPSQHSEIRKKTGL